MYKTLLSILTTLLLTCSMWAQENQVPKYVVVHSELESASVVKLQIKTFSKDKNTVDADAQRAAIRTILFDGIPETQYRKPMLNDGEKTLTEQHPTYFYKLFNDRYTDFIIDYSMLSKFKKADKDKSTLYEVRVKILQLRKDLEKNNIRKQIGI